MRTPAPAAKAAPSTIPDRKGVGGLTELNLTIRSKNRLLVEINGFHKPLPDELDAALQAAWRGLSTIQKIEALMPRRNTYILHCYAAVVYGDAGETAQRVYDRWSGKYKAGGVAD